MVFWLWGAEFKSVWGKCLVIFGYLGILVGFCGKCGEMGPSPLHFELLFGSVCVKYVLELNVVVLRLLEMKNAGQNGPFVPGACC